jgi:hypothetical protein
LLAALSAVAVLVMWAGAGGRALADDKRVGAQGRVLNAAGEGMPGWPVILIGTQRYIELKKFASGGSIGTLARVTTDVNGYFSIDVPKDRHYQFWFLRFAEPGQIDTVKYVIPDDVEITEDARRGRVAALDKTIRMNPDWPEIERRVAEAGGETTERGRILRTLGLPEKNVKDQAAGTEEWWYFTRGVLYTFNGTQPATLRKFEPVKPPGREAN